MGAPVLLVHDDIAAIAAVRRLLAREGYEVVLATSAADAVIAFGHHLPSLIVLAPQVEQGRGRVVLEELALHPDAKLARVLLLGETIPGFGAPVVPLPLDGAMFLQAVAEAMRSSSEADQWQVLEQSRLLEEAVPAPSGEPEPWRAREPLPPSPLPVQGSKEERAPVGAAEAEAAAQAAYEKAQEEIEAEAMATLESVLDSQPPPPRPPSAAEDQELQQLEDEVRAEAQRRRQRRVTPAPAPSAPPEGNADEPVEERAGSDSELSWVEREAAQAREREKELALEAAEREGEAQRARARAEELAEREQAAREAAAQAMEAAQAAEREARERAARDRQEQERAEAETRERVRREQRERERLAAELEAAKLATEQAQEEAALAAQRAEAERLKAEATERARLEAEAQAQRAQKEAEEANLRAEKVTQPLALPHRPGLGVPRAGRLSQEELIGLLTQLCLSRLEVKLELQSPEALRVLWLRRGQLLAATSSAPYESLLDRARRDGLIDSRQEEELRLMRAASSAELLEVLQGRGYLREIEVVPLVQRHTEQLALEALSEPDSLYRLALEPPPPEVALAASLRPALRIGVEALRRAATAEPMLHSLGGLCAVPFSLESDLDARELGFSERERRLLLALDGKSTVEDLILAAGIQQDAALKALTVARALGMVGLHAPSSPAPVPADLDLKRLEAKYEQVQEADYFSILGLSRSAGTEEVQRAFQALASEFHPLKFTGHSDPALQHRAQRIHELLAEAAQALGDDRLRAEYARHLLD